jgi:hypothetical protein
MKRRLVSILLVLAGAGLVIGVVLPAFTGLPLIRRTVVETLENPVQIRDLHPDGLETIDGRVIRLRFVKEIPVTNAIFVAATAKGVELSPGGKAVGLIDVHHWCGNDPIGKHLGRVDLAALALYLGAKPTESLPELLRDLEHKSIFRDRIDPGDYGSIQTLAMIMEMDSPTTDSTLPTEDASSVEE